MKSLFAFRLSRTTVLAALAFALVLLATPRPGLAGEGIVIVNQHQTYHSSDCVYPLGGPEACASTTTNPGVALPFTALEGSQHLDGFAYHIHGYGPVGNQDPTKGSPCQALCKYRYAGVPKILSSDWPNVENWHAETWIQWVCDDAELEDKQGRVHFEHFDRFLNLYGEAGHCIGDFTDWPSGARDLLDRYPAHCASELGQNGRLQRGDLSGESLDRYFWTGLRTKNEPATLLGYGFMGGLTAGDRLEPHNFFRILKSHRANFIRVWAVEQWQALAEDDAFPDCVTPDQVQGPTPFKGAWEPDPQIRGNYHLDQPAPKFYDRLRQFAQAAADRGVVVLLTLNDKHGLANWGSAPCGEHRWYQNPYNKDNNTTSPPEYLVGGDLCACLTEEEAKELAASPCLPGDFLTHTRLLNNLRWFMERTAKEVGGMGNVMFEIFNEAMDGDWDLEPLVDWQEARAQDMKGYLPKFVARDAFNGVVGDPVVLDGMLPDVGAATSPEWFADNVKIVPSADPDTGLYLGYATSNAEPGELDMSAELPFPAPASWGELQVRGGLTATSGSLTLGVRAGAVNLWTLLNSSGPTPSVQLWLAAPGILVPQMLGSATLANPTSPHEVRMHVKKMGPYWWIINVWVDYQLPAGLTNRNAYPPQGFPAVSHAYFGGASDAGEGNAPQTSYPVDAGKVDNFEAEFFDTIVIP